MVKRLGFVSKTLVIVTIILLFGMSLNTSAINVEDKKSTIPTIGNILYVGGTGEGNHTNIQDAIDDAFDGDTIVVYPKIYKENILVNKQLTLKGIKVENIPTIDGCEIKDVVTITADYCSLEGFNVVNSSETNWTYSGISISSCNNVIKDNILSDNFNGIWLEGSDNNIIYNNNFCLNTLGVSLAKSCGNNISNNGFYNNTLGIHLLFLSNYNVFSNNIFDGTGFQITQSSNNEITKNSITNQYNVISPNFGLALYLSNNNIIMQNKIENYEWWGISIETSKNNMISRNNIMYNGLYGIYLSGLSRKNTIKQNNFIENGFNDDFIPKIIPTENAFFIKCFLNKWEENYWDDWTYKLPRPIKGRMGIIGLTPFLNFDLHPAEEPYNI